MNSQNGEGYIESEINGYLKAILACESKSKEQMILKTIQKKWGQKA